MIKLIFRDGRPVPSWYARMLADGDRATTNPVDTFWADMRARIAILAADIKTLEVEADELILDLTRFSMGSEL